MASGSLRWALSCRLVALTSCNGISDVSLPGGSATSGKVYHVKVDLQRRARPGSAGLGTGRRRARRRRQQIDLHGFNAVVSLRIKVQRQAAEERACRAAQHQPAGGEVRRAEHRRPAPIKPVPVGSSNGDTIPLANTGRNPEFEEVFTALSALLNGGGVSQIQTISVELTNALSGREAQVKDVLSQLTDARRLAGRFQAADRHGARTPSIGWPSSWPCRRARSPRRSTTSRAR